MIDRLLGRLHRALIRARIPYMIIGGQAVLFYGSPRLTQDVDVTLGIDPDEYTALRTLCERAKLTPLVDQPETFARKTHVLPVRDPASGLRVDFIFSSTPYERQAIGRARHARVGSTSVRFASPEDLIIHKLVAGRAIDVEDIRRLLLTHGRALDTRYVRRWLKSFSELGTLETDPLKTFEQLQRATSKR